MRWVYTVPNRKKFLAIATRKPFMFPDSGQLKVSHATFCWDGLSGLGLKIQGGCGLTIAAKRRF
jgi:hypothetical protein